ncbi:hypothetical protein Hanom_Chr13g01213701 [Helianthus anomalus]
MSNNGVPGLPQIECLPIQMASRFTRKPDYVCRYIHSDDGDLVKYKLLRSNLDEERWVSIKDTKK